VVTTGEGAVWAAGNGGHLIRIDPGSNQVRSVGNLRSPPAGITFADGSLWVASAIGGILRVNPSTGIIEATLPGGGSPGGLQTRGDRTSMLGMTLGNGIIWVTGKLGGTVERIIADGNTVLEPIKVGQTPTGVAAGFGSVWVTVDVATSG
jgi:streptogramin lyase